MFKPDDFQYAMENTQVTGVDPSGARVELLVVIADSPEN